MIEYAVLDHKGNVINICMSSKSVSEIKESYGGIYDIKPVEQVPESTLSRYRYWNERP